MKASPAKARNRNSNSDSDEELEDGKVTREGHISILHQKKTWKPVFSILIGGSLYYYKNSTEPDPKGRVDLEGCKVVSPVKGDKKYQHTFALLKGDEAIITGACSGAKELEEWVKSLEENLDKDKSDPPILKDDKRKKVGWGTRFKKNIIQDATSSVLGKKVMKTVLNDEKIALRNAVKKVVRTESGSSKKADDLERNIIKLSVKAFLLIDDKEISVEEFLVADKLLRHAFDLLTKVYYSREKTKPEKIKDALIKVEEILKQAEEVLTKLFAPHLTAKNILKISSIFGCLGDVKFLENILNDKSLTADMDKIVETMEYYSQLNFP